RWRNPQHVIHPTKEGRMTTSIVTEHNHAADNPPHSRAFKPYDLAGLMTYDLSGRPSKVFHDDLGRPVASGTSVDQWLASLPRQRAAAELRRVSKHLVRAHKNDRTAAAALGGHVIKTGCAPYLVDWIQRGILKAVALNGSAAIHDLELAVAGKTSE